jgi:DNA-binding response OmpR family regulator
MTAHNRRILIADDDDILITGVAELLRRRGFDVRTTNDLGDKATFESYELVIFDPLIGDRGLIAAREFVDRMRRQSPPPSLIVVSEFIDSVEQVGAEAGPRATLHVKPVRVAALAESVEVMLRESGSDLAARGGSS